jgi:hypothetical protein
LLLCGTAGLAQDTGRRTQDAGPRSFVLSGYLTGRGAYVNSQPSWLEGGFGRFGVGAESPHDDAFRGYGSLQLGADYTPNPWFTAHAQAIARAEPSGSKGKRAGVVEAYAELHGESWRVRAGQFFLGTSRENIEPLWNSPYTITWSALNTWIGEEFRPVGIDAQWSPTFYATIGGTAFRNNDTSGALLAWRGWAFGNRLTVYNEVLPLPPLFSLPTAFDDQRHDGTKPFGRDLDGRTGYSLRARLSLPERAMLQLTHVDNRGDREEYPSGRGIEYSWATRFDMIGAQIGTTSPTTLLAEYAWGSTGMGSAPNFVDAGFYAGYVLVSHKSARFRTTARIDTFGTSDRDHILEDNSEHGIGWTLAAFYEPTGRLRTGVEFSSVSARRNAAAQSGFDPNTDGKTVTVELRYRY